LQRRFPVDDILFQSGDICYSRKMAQLKTTFFAPKIFGEKNPQNQMRTFYAPKATDKVGKFGAIPPTDPDDISQSTPDFWPIFEFQASKNCRGQTHPQ